MPNDRPIFPKNPNALTPKEVAERHARSAAELLDALRAVVGDAAPVGLRKPVDDQLYAGGREYEGGHVFGGWRVFIGGLELDVVHWRRTLDEGEPPRRDPKRSGIIPM